jgi:preprotein translocase subunit SecE
MSSRSVWTIQRDPASKKRIIIFLESIFNLVKKYIFPIKFSLRGNTLLVLEIRCFFRPA